jgi:hypothetical protein
MTPTTSIADFPDTVGVLCQSLINHALYLNLTGISNEILIKLEAAIAINEQTVLYIYHIDVCRGRCTLHIQNATQHGVGHLALLPISENTASSLRCIVRNGSSVQIVFRRIEI